MAFSETANLAVKLTLGGNFTSQMAKARANLRGLDKDASRAYKAGAQIGTGIKRGAILAAGGFTLLAGAVAKSVGAAGDFEAQLNTINTIAFKNAAGLKEIGDGIRTIAKQSGLSLDDLTASYYDLLSASVKTADAQAVLNDAVTLGIGGLATTAEAVDLLTTAYNAYGLDAKGAAVATDQFAQAVADGKVKASEIAATFANVASIAKAYHIGIDQIAASYGFLTAQGVPAAEVTTEMNRAIISLIKPSKELAAAQKKLGVNFATLIQKKGLVPALEVLRKYSDKTGIPLISLLGRVEAVKYALQTTGPNAKGFAAELDRIRKSSGEASKQMAEREQGLNFQLSIFKARIKDAGITIGTALLPKLTPVVEELNKFLDQNQGRIADFGTQLASAFTPEGVIDGIKGITSALGPMIDLIKVSAAPVKAIVNAFLALPKEVQTVLIGAFAVNKLTGGLVTNVFGGIAEAIAKSIIRAPLVNVTGGVVNVSGGLPGTPGTPSASGGGKGGTLKTLAKEVLPLVVPVAAGILAGTVVATNQAQVFNQPGADPKAVNDLVKTGKVIYNGRVFQQVAQTPKAVKDASKTDSRATLQVEQATKRMQSVLANSLSQVHAKAQATAAAVKDADSTISGKVSGTTAATRAGAATVAAAVRASQPITNVDIKVSVTAAGITKTVTVQNRYGPGTGSAAKDSGAPGGAFGGQ